MEKSLKDSIQKVVVNSPKQNWNIFVSGVPQS